MAEQYANGYETTLSADITNVQTTLTLVSDVGAPAAPFRIRVNNELMYVGARVGTACSSITRGVEGSTAAAHTAGSPITAVVTARGLRELSINQLLAVAADPIVSARRSGDSVDRFQVNEAGLIAWGAGAAAADARISRALSGTLLIDSNSAASSTVLRVESTAGQNAEVFLRASGDTFQRTSLRGDAAAASLGFGPGSGNADTRLRRSAANVLQFDNNASAALVAVDFLGALLRGFSGTSFPASPTTNDRFYRTDHQMWFVWDGTRWHCTCPHETQFVMANTVAMPLTATASVRFFATLPVEVGLDILLTDTECFFQVITGGTALGASHHWVGTVISRAAAATVATLTINSGTSAIYRRTGVSGTTVIDTTAAEQGLTLTWTKTGTPGNLEQLVTIYYRFIAV